MEGPFGAEWPEEEKVKRREMSSPEALYIFVKVPSTSDNAKASIIGFVHYRFTIEEGIPVLYLYELQLEPAYQGQGIGKILMELIELIAFKNGMGAVVLTVQKQNTLAVNFYLNTLSYNISAISPSKVYQLMGVIGQEKSYEILCKTFDCEPEAKAVLERDLQTGQFSNLTEKFCDNQDYVNPIAQSEQQQMEALRDSQSGTSTPKSDDAILSQVLGEL